MVQTEDGTCHLPFIWSDQDTFYAIVDDQYGSYLGEHGLALFESADGVKWRPSAHTMVSPLQLAWADGSITKPMNVERPQLWFDAGGHPAMLFVACRDAIRMPDGTRGFNSYNVHIPLRAKP